MESFLDRLFLNPSLAEDILGLGNWDESALMRIFHPTLQQRLDEALRLAENMERLTRRQPASPEEASRRVTEAMERTVAGYEPEPSCPGEESWELAGMCLWDVCGEHEVIDPEGREVDLGSWRGSAGVIADWLNEHGPVQHYQYEDFYMGSSLVGHRADLKTVYRLIFARLKAHRFDWRYHFPRLNVVHFGGGEPDDAYLKIKTDLDLAHDEDRRRARAQEPPSIVQAYIDVFGRNPSGWPP